MKIILFIHLTVDREIIECKRNPFLLQYPLDVIGHYILSFSSIHASTHKESIVCNLTKLMEWSEKECYKQEDDYNSIKTCIKKT